MPRSRFEKDTTRVQVSNLIILAVLLCGVVDCKIHNAVLISKVMSLSQFDGTYRESNCSRQVSKPRSTGRILLWCTQSAEYVLLPSPISTTPRLALGPTQPPVRWVLASLLGGNYVSTSWRGMGQFYFLLPFVFHRRSYCC